MWACLTVDGAFTAIFDSKDSNDEHKTKIEGVNHGNIITDELGQTMEYFGFVLCLGVNHALIDEYCPTGK